MRKNIDILRLFKHFIKTKNAKEAALKSVWNGIFMTPSLTTSSWRAGRCKVLWSFSSGGCAMAEAVE